MTHICVSKLTTIGSDNGLSPGRRQTIIWTNAGMLLIGTLGTNFSEILSEIQTFSSKKMYMNMSSGKWWPFYLGLNVVRAFLSSSMQACPNIAWSVSPQRTHSRHPHGRAMGYRFWVQNMTYVRARASNDLYGVKLTILPAMPILCFHVYVYLNVLVKLTECVYACRGI